MDPEGLPPCVSTSDPLRLPGIDTTSEPLALIVPLAGEGVVRAARSGSIVTEPVREDRRA